MIAMVAECLLFVWRLAPWHLLSLGTCLPDSGGNAALYSTLYSTVLYYGAAGGARAAVFCMSLWLLAAGCWLLQNLGH